MDFLQQNKWFEILFLEILIIWRTVMSFFVLPGILHNRKPRFLICEGAGEGRGFVTSPI